ncbi:MerR family transcriptional regulator [Actinoplanes bogorensis]|uniref:MerR family transcriptional regulator n=1 Tax=Paractinoplanes bogorensis TaxID=1610840 RepID=A0ABS5YEU3_9ACTN|nr:MerR family transcriptional regulator [Actinoplanes bogorensis]MBU2661925.1 MerR family transcriptional regulator [Actinoplanes bogorensis]
MKIGELSAATGVSPRSLRHYEANGLIEAERTPGRQREYPQETLDRVDLIQQLLGAGLVSNEIRPILNAVAAGESSEELVAELLARREVLAQRLAGLSTAIKRLEEMVAIARSPELHCAPAQEFPPRPASTRRASQPR